jgi:rare lipoprotein A
MKAGLLALAIALAVTGCSVKHPPQPTDEASAERAPSSNRSGAKRTPPKSNIGRYQLANDEAPDYADIPPHLLNIPDAVPVAEPRSRGGNSPEYEVYGATYRVLASAEGYRERGGASWYGRKFHGHLTANGEIYDMFAMTAAHRTLPIPSYVRVTRVDTDQSVVVRVNDRGPFHEGRIIDLSYAAAAKLDMLGSGSAEVWVEAIIPEGPSRARAPQPAAVASASVSAAPAINAAGMPAGYWQAGAFLLAANASALYDRLRDSALNHVSIHETSRNGERFFRVVVGPYATQREGERTRRQLQGWGLNPLWIVAR